MTWVSIATEDEPSEAVAERLVQDAGGSVYLRLRKGGFGYLKSSLAKFSKIADQQPVLLLTDLDRGDCPLRLIEDWRGGGLSPQLYFRVVVREIEAWLLADREGFGEFLGVPSRLIPGEPEALHDPKAKVLELAQRARAGLRAELLPARGAIASQGLGYSARLAEFASNGWDLARATERAPSLARAVQRLRSANFGGA